MQSPEFIQASHVALYLASDGEVNPSTILEQALRMGKKCFLPVIHPFKSRTLLFAPFTPQTRLIKNRFNILEPVNALHTAKPIWCINVVYTPLVGFDKNGNRLGMGGGFYDTTFRISNRPIRNPTLIGLAHSCQQVDSLSKCPWDVSMDKILIA